MKKFLSGTVLRLILWLVSILIIIPLGWTIVQSFKTTQEFSGMFGRFQRHFILKIMRMLGQPPTWGRIF